MTLRRTGAVLITAAVLTTTSALPSWAAVAASPELVVNGDLAAGGAVPTCFLPAGWGEGASAASAVADVPSGASGRSWRITTSGYVSGDRKLLLDEAAGCAPAVTPGQRYDIALAYRSSAARQAVTLFVHDASGWRYWTDVAALAASASWTTASARTPAVPAGVDRISYGVSLSSDGELTTTGYSMKLVPATPPPPPPPPSDPAVAGRWSVAATNMPLRGIHTTLLRDGRVLLIAGTGNVQEEFVAGSFKTSVWNPTTGVFTAIPTPEDLFCAGHATLADGRVLIAGGTQQYPGTGGAVNFQGTRHTYAFDPATNRYQRLGDMVDGHWYPTLTKLETGDVWAAGGLNEVSEGTVTTELFSSAQQQWLPTAQVPQTYTYWGTYPHMFLMADGRIFYSGGHTFGDQRPGTGASLYDWRTATVADLPGLREPNLRDQAGSVLLPPAQDQKVMIVGGGHVEQYADGIATTDIIDLKAAQPRYVPAPDVPGGGRTYMSLVTLPDRTVLATGGAHGNRGEEVISSSTFDPANNRWLDTADDPIGRGYHSTSLLLPDGRVALFGSNPGDNSFELRISLYEPPYLFKGRRPTIESAPTRATRGTGITLRVSGDVTSASLTSPASVTHQTDTNTRLVDLPITGTGTATTRTARVPANAALLPPGPYMLTVTDSRGVPSVARWVTVS